MRKTLLAVGLAVSLEGAGAAQPEDPARASAQECNSAPFDLSAEDKTLICAALAGPMDPAVRLVRIDAALARIPGPSPENVLLTSARVQMLGRIGRRADALREMRLAMQRYPRIAPLWSHGIGEFAFTEYTAEAADFWIELARFNPEMGRKIGGYVWRAIRERLKTQGNADKVHALARALEAIGYDGGNEASRSALAEELFTEALASGATARARELLPRISNPETLAQIAVGAETRQLWDKVAWADADNRAAALRRWIVGLGEAAQDDAELAGRFMSGVALHMGPEPVLAAYEPLLREAMRDRTAGPGEGGLAFLLAPLANAHAIAGDDAGAEALYRDALAFFATLNNPARLNVSANLALFLQVRGRNEEALALIDAAIAEMQREGGVDTALLQMHGVRTRALAGLGREPEAWRSLELLRQNRVAAADVYLHTLLGLGRYDEARDLLVEQLRGQGESMHAVLFLQRPIAAFSPRRDVVPEEVMERLRHDPAVLEALEGKGRILAVEPVRLEPIDLPPLKLRPPRQLG